MKTFLRTYEKREYYFYRSNPILANFMNYLIHTPVVTMTYKYLIIITIHRILQTLHQEWAKIMMIKLIQINVGIGTDEGKFVPFIIKCTAHFQLTSTEHKK